MKRYLDDNVGNMNLTTNQKKSIVKPLLFDSVAITEMSQLL